MTNNPFLQQPQRPFVIGMTAKQKQQIVTNIDRCCSLYYITMGSILNTCQSAMIDARDFIKEHEPKFYRQGIKLNIKRALAAYEKWNAKMKYTLKDRYQIWLDLSDSVYEEITPMITTLYYSIDNYLLKFNAPHSKVFSRLETARILLDIARNIYEDLFDKIYKRIKIDIREMFDDGNAADMMHYWDEAIHSFTKVCPIVPDINLNDDSVTTQAVNNILRRVTDENIYNRSGEYALRLNPDQWRVLDKETRMRLKQGLPINE